MKNTTNKRKIEREQKRRKFLIIATERQAKRLQENQQAINTITEAISMFLLDDITKQLLKRVKLVLILLISFTSLQAQDASKHFVGVGLQSFNNKTAVTFQLQKHQRALEFTSLDFCFIDKRNGALEIGERFYNSDKLLKFFLEPSGCLYVVNNTLNVGAGLKAGLNVGSFENLSIDLFLKYSLITGGNSYFNTGFCIKLCID
jgi:hypothetical protein